MNIELRDINVVRTPDADDESNGHHAYRAFAKGPNDEWFFADVWITPPVEAAPNEFAQLVRSTLEGTYRGLLNRWEYDLANRAAAILAGQYLTAPRCYFEPNARKLRFPSGGDAADITIEVPSERPVDLDAAADEAVRLYVNMLPHRFDA